ncbi:MAG: chorismate mutase [Clostridiales bacterium]|nr:chorismate mutase [Clostridiales bacterium]
MQTLEESRREIDRIDREMARLFEERMRTVAQVIDYKKAVGMPILDSSREAAIIEKNSAYIQDPALLDYYRRFIQAQMDLSKEYQRTLL